VQLAIPSGAEALLWVLRDPARLRAARKAARARRARAGGTGVRVLHLGVNEDFPPARLAYPVLIVEAGFRVRPDGSSAGTTPSPQWSGGQSRWPDRRRGAWDV